MVSVLQLLSKVLVPLLLALPISSQYKTPEQVSKPVEPSVNATWLDSDSPSAPEVDVSHVVENDPGTIGAADTWWPKNTSVAKAQDNAIFSAPT